MSVGKVMLVQGNVAKISLADESVQVCITSPPYWALRSYNTGNLKSLELGAEPLHDCLGWATGNNCGECYVCRTRAWAREIWRVLRKDGTFWLNIGDSYTGSANTGGTGPRGNGGVPYRISGLHPKLGKGLKPKDLCSIPFRVALALQADGWTLRSVSPWPKKSAMPESTKDRFSVSHEYWLMFVKSQKYYADPDAIRKEHVSLDRPPGNKSRIVKGREWNNGDRRPSIEQSFNPSSRNYRTSDVFFSGLDILIDETAAYLSHLKQIRDKGGMMLTPEGDPAALVFNTKGFSGAHFATFNPKMIEPLVKFSTSERGCCPKCKMPWRRVVERGKMYDHITTDPGKSKAGPYASQTGNGKGTHDIRHGVYSSATTTGWRPGCTCYGKPHIEQAPCTKCDGTGRELIYKTELLRKEEAAKMGRTDSKMSGPGGQNYKIETGEPCPDCDGTGVTETEVWPDDVDEWPKIPCVVFDPFIGSGTTAMVAQKLGRYGIGIDLSAEYLRMAKDRTGMTLLEGKLPQKKKEVSKDNMPLFAGLKE